MLLIPLFTYKLYPTLGNLWQLTPLRKVGIGLFVTVAAFAVPAWIQMRIDAGEQPHIIWQVVAYIILTSAEVLVSITALEFSYTQAPRTMKSFIMGLYMLSVTVGNLFVAIVNVFIQSEQAGGGKSRLDGAAYYWFFTACMLGTAVLFVLWSQFYRGQTYIQGDDADGAEPQAAA